MKKLLIVVLCAAMSIALVSCSSGVSQGDYDKLKNDLTELQSQYDEVVAERDLLKDQISTMTEEASVSDAPTAQAESTSPATTQQVLVDQDGILITYNGLQENELWGQELKITIENNTDQPITVQTRDVSLNGYMIDPILSADVAAGKKSNSTITIMESDLEANGITTFETIELRLIAINSNTWDDVLDSELITINL
ncbi:hypothetical protein [Christensenella tenuis]|uniref:DUF4352 domain-containing protein n=1 Tax=Christensenella tenuis TaxID=2763033 RepID=A0ABR7ECR7_9FIRM|nr:hypothetical protein [Christensenella tenuis]MBC5647536.1 hypothetical protein [Christensenella tenuis]